MHVRALGYTTVFQSVGALPRYGEDAGQAATSVATMSKSVIKAWSARRTGVRAVATRIAKHTARGLAGEGRATNVAGAT